MITQAAKRDHEAGGTLWEEAGSPGSRQQGMGRSPRGVNEPENAGKGSRETRKSS